jgi:hypothetical protein
MRLREISSEDSAFFLKSEYGPLSEFWPAVAFSSLRVKTEIERNYRAGLDFVLYTGTSGPETEQPEHRSRLLSLVRVDLLQTWRTEQLVPTASWQWARDNYPGQWEYAFGVIDGWSIVERPPSAEMLPESYAKMGRFPFRGSVVRISEAEKQQLLDLRLEHVVLPNRQPMRRALTLDAVLRNFDLNVEATRIAELVFNRVTALGSLQRRAGPLQIAPGDFLLRVAERLMETPLVCALCGGEIRIRPDNRLLQASPGPLDSVNEVYGTENFHLAHLGCNVAKIDASVEQFSEWLQVASGGYNPDAGEESAVDPAL